MKHQTRFILDSGDPDEYQEIALLANEHHQELWGGTTNPTLIAKKLAGHSASLMARKKFTKDEAFNLQRKIILELTTIVPGAVSAEVYADHTTTAEEMIEQGRQIATWHERVVVKLPTTIEGFKTRSVLRKEGILTNNTLVFSQEQIFAICLHEEIIQRETPSRNIWPPFISPFVGRLDDLEFDGMDIVQNGMQIKKIFNAKLWMLVASVRELEDFKRGIELQSELITAPAKTYRNWFALSEEKQDAISPWEHEKTLQSIPTWQAPTALLTTQTLDEFQNLIDSGILNINHPLTEKGITRFAKDWKAILTTQ